MLIHEMMRAAVTMPDPSSQPACTIGGNIATNSGGPHTLKYGVTANHVLGLTLVLPDGEVVELGGRTEDPPGFDLLGAVVGSEGTFGLITEAILRLTRNPSAYRTLLAVFDNSRSACFGVTVALLMLLLGFGSVVVVVAAALLSTAAAPVTRAVRTKLRVRPLASDPTFQIPVASS